MFLRLVGTRFAVAVAILLIGPWSYVAAADSPQKVPRVGYLSPGSPSDPGRQRRFQVFREGLRELGYVEGHNIAIESRWAEGKYDRDLGLAADLVRSKVDVIVAVGGPATMAAKQATKTIPIVMSVVIDPVGSGLVPSLARPGGNVTGISMMAADLVSKQLEVLKEVIPKISRVALLWNPANPGSASQFREAEAAARALGVRLQSLEVRVPREIEGTFGAMARERAGGLVVLADGLLTNQRKLIVELAAAKHLPAVYPQREYAEAGGLMVFSANPLDLERRAATYVDKILKGAKPGDLPVEQPTKLELVINLNTAKALGLTIPPTLLLRVHEVIE
jgi:putative ABC transport system substrate-binding protein